MPILRCQIDPSQMLNLSFDGEVYASSTYWEERFVDQFPITYAAPILILRDQRPIAARLPPQSPSLPAGIVDLTPAINACLGDPWIEGRGNELLPLPKDVATVLQASGVVFELRGIVQTLARCARKVLAKDLESAFIPPNSAPIPIARRCARIHLLHATAFRVSRGEQVGKYESHDDERAGVRNSAARGAGNRLLANGARRSAAPGAVARRSGRRRPVRPLPLDVAERASR